MPPDGFIGGESDNLIELQWEGWKYRNWLLWRLLGSRITVQPIAQLLRLRIAGVQAQSHCRGFAGFGETFLHRQLGSQIDPCLCPRRSCMNRHLEMLNGSGSIAAARKHVAQLPLRARQVWIELDRLFEQLAFTIIISGLL